MSVLVSEPWWWARHERAARVARGRHWQGRRGDHPGRRSGERSP